MMMTIINQYARHVPQVPNTSESAEKTDAVCVGSLVVPVPLAVAPSTAGTDNLGN